MAIWNKKVLSLMFQWDYGQVKRGESLESACFHSTLTELVAVADVLWLDAHVNNHDELQKIIVEKVRESAPDLVFCIPMGEEISVETLRQLKAKCQTYAWFSDDQWRFDSFTKRYAPHFTYVSTTEPWCVEKYRKIGVEPILTQWAARPYSDIIGPLGESEPYLYNVSFVGSCNKFRKWFIRQLSLQGIIVDCFGAGWPNGRVSNQQMEQIFRKSRINLNISNSVSHDIRFILGHPLNLLHYIRSPKRVESTKARNFEILLAGGFQLTNYVPCLEQYVKIGDEVALYSTPEECACQIRYYLDESDLRKQIAARGYARAISEHTYRHRLTHILGTIFGAMNVNESGT